MRFNTSRFKNLFIVIPKLENNFRIIDLSSNGVKIFTKLTDLNDAFPLNQPITPVEIKISKFSGELGQVVPRVHKGNTIGCEMVYENNGPAHKYILHLLNSLLKSEEGALSTDDF